MIELKPLQGQVRKLVDDLRAQVTAGGSLRDALQAEYKQARAAERTGGTFEAWTEDVLDQAAVAWVLGCVFVRFCEDNDLVEPLWIGGSEPAAPAERAMQARQAYIIANPLHNDRHWLRQAFTYLAGLRATGKLFDEHNPVWRFDISGEAAEDLSEFFRRGPGAVSLRTSALDTRFLGDLYQDLSAHARTTYALLQTPEFVEEFILDRTFEPALAQFGLEAMSVIDPTCGSGHFLLGAFNRLVRRWVVREPNTDIRVLVERALGQVTGVDINPFAVAIARFRLMVAALRVCGMSDLERAPSFPMRVAAGDSLLEWGERSRHQGDLLALSEGRSEFAYYTEDGDLLASYLHPGQYAAVVGNPPYKQMKDPTVSALYRRLYPSVCYRQYRLGAPFAQRFFDLAQRSDDAGVGAGWVGQITDNAFMKREWGKKLIEEYFAHQIELMEIIDTSGAFIPHHGTGTVILIGRANNRYRAPNLRGVLGAKGEPSQPVDPAQGVVWLSIVALINRPGLESQWVSSVDLSRQSLARHPWSLAGGGAFELKEFLDKSSSTRLNSTLADWGNIANTREDDAYVVPAQAQGNERFDTICRRPFVEGGDIRDWRINPTHELLFPYTTRGLERELTTAELRMLWPSRQLLRIRQSLSGSQEDRGLPWFTYSSFSPNRYTVDRALVFALVSTLPHFAVRRGGNSVFPQAATILILPERASEDDHLGLLGVLNSSTACFWLKQVSQPKAGTSNTSGGGNRWSPEPWYERYEFTGTKLEEYPLPSSLPADNPRKLDGHASRLSRVSPAAIVGAGTPTREHLAAAESEWYRTRREMISLQEESDWQVYRLYGLLDEDLFTPEPPDLGLGERAFEIYLARQVEAGRADTQWFARHGSDAITELPERWPEDYRSLVERRIAAIENNRYIGLIERPECKRRWATEGWDALETAALREWLLDQLEMPMLWAKGPVPLSVAQIADKIRHDEDFRSVLDLWIGTDHHGLTKSIAKLIAEEHVPFLSVDRYKTSGLRKRAEWERTWRLQRRENVGEVVEIAVPTKYTSADFIKPSYMRHRGKLDVPKERFISYPQAGLDGGLLLGWAGWDHLAQARALAAVYLDRKTNAAWKDDQLLRLLAGIAELEPWLHQWYSEPQPGFPGSPADFFTALIDAELAHLRADRAALAKVRGVEELA